MGAGHPYSEVRLIHLTEMEDVSFLLTKHADKTLTVVHHSYMIFMKYSTIS